MKCLLTDSKKFKKIYTIKKFPIFMGTVNKSYKCKFQDLNYWINKDSGTVQVYPRVSIYDLYFKSHSPGTIGKVWQNHHKLFRNLIFKYLKGTVLEIGGGHNSISLKNDKKAGIKIITFDPNAIPKKNNKNIKIIKNFFSRKELIKNNIKPKSLNVIIHSHLIEHIYQPKKFFSLINKYLSDDGYHIFSLPNMEAMIKRGYSNTIMFEHPFYLNEKLVDTLLVTSGFKILRKKYYEKDHSIFYVTKKKFYSLAKQSISLKKLYSKNHKIFKNVFKSWELDVQNLNKKIGDKNFYLFGAHIFSQLLIKLGINSKNILGILDNDPRKHGFYLYGTSYKVFLPKILKKFNKPVIVLRSGQYSKEIKKQIHKINPSSVII
jgi:2-polyprenyl-3-methyl-5-hydroxy-6-metoxy-1,4-benzoquinol methylase